MFLSVINAFCCAWVAGTICPIRVEVSGPSKTIFCYLHNVTYGNTIYLPSAFRNFLLIWSIVVQVFSNMCYQCWSYRLLIILSQVQYPDPYLQSPCWSEPRRSKGMSTLHSRTQCSGSTACAKEAGRDVENRCGNMTVCPRWQISGHQHGYIPWHGCLSAPAERHLTALLQVSIV